MRCPHCGKEIKELVVKQTVEITGSLNVETGETVWENDWWAKEEPKYFCPHCGKEVKTWEQ